MADSAWHSLRQDGERLILRDGRRRRMKDVSRCGYESARRLEIEWLPNGYTIALLAMEGATVIEEDNAACAEALRTWLQWVTEPVS